MQDFEMSACSSDARALDFDDKWKTATTKKPLPHDHTEEEVEGLIADAKKNGMKSLLVDVETLCGKMGGRFLMYPAETEAARFYFSLDGNDGYPEGIHASTSSAVIVWREKDGKNEYLIVKEKSRTYSSFVAGGSKPGEDTLRTAEREVLEEVGLELVKEGAVWLQSAVMNGVHGEVNILTTIAAEVKDPFGPLKVQASEIESARWLSEKDMYDALTFDTAKDALTAFIAGRGRDIKPNKWGRYTVTA
jgi:8-oxo-dGTP pyrophosphatase MutT (NUDIX family)